MIYIAFFATDMNTISYCYWYHHHRLGTLHPDGVPIQTNFFQGGVLDNTNADGETCLRKGVVKMKGGVNERRGV